MPCNRIGPRGGVGDAACFLVAVHLNPISAWISPLADIFVQCPSTGAAVSTGLKTEWVLLRSLPPVPIPLRCPACGQVHKWVARQAWAGPALPHDPDAPDRANRFATPASADG